MKKLLFCCMLLFATTFIFSQEEHQPPPGPPPLADRWKHDSTTIAASISLSADQSKKTKACFFNFYRDMDALREKYKGTRPAKEEVEKLVQKRDEAVKTTLNREQAEKYKSIKKQLMPPPPGQGKQPPPSKK